MTDKVVRWADHLSGEAIVAYHPRYLGEDKGFVPMPESTALGLGLATIGEIGVDLVTLRAGESFSPHTHPGHHVLIVVRGRGTICIDQTVYPTFPGTVYIAPGEVPHAVGAIDDHSILAVGAPHRTVDDPMRATLVEYAAVASKLGRVWCRACPSLSTEFGVYPLRTPGSCAHVPASWAD